MVFRMRPSAIAVGLLTYVLAGLLPAAANAQYFGRNKVLYKDLKFEMLATEHFDVYFYPEEAKAATEVARMAERWHARLSRVLGHTLTGRQPVILYASHPHFQQTNVVEGISEGTGGVTEGARRRVVLPMGASLADTDHVLGHELVHAFQYDVLGRNAGYIPLWFIEGMAEYLSIGSRYPQTAMWLRDSALQNKLPALKDLDHPRYFPYRFGHAFWAYFGGRYGDAAIGQVLAALGPGPEGLGAPGNIVEVIEAASGLTADEFTQQWHAAIRATYDIAANPDPKDAPPPPNVIGVQTGSGSVNVGPALSPDGSKIAFLSERDRLSIDLFLADARTGKVIRKLIETASDPHFESLQFLSSAGAWDAAGQRLALGTQRSGRPVLTILDTERGRIAQEIPFDDLGEIFHPTWSPDGNAVAFAAQVGGHTDLFVHDLTSGQTRRLTEDVFADLQPAWSPDGRRLAFVTDRHLADLGALSFRGFGLATLTLSDGTVTPVQTGLRGNAINPQWGENGAALFFIADAGGRPNVWRIRTEGEPQPVRITGEITGVSGITPMSPALSIAGASTRAAVSVFHDSSYLIRLLDLTAIEPLPAAATSTSDLALLPPTQRTAAVVDPLLAAPQQGLPPESVGEVKPYESGMSLTGVGSGVGVSTGGMFGTYASGGIALMFSDVLGNHLIGTSFGIDGGVRDISGAITYLNRTRRLNWGLYFEHVPLLSGFVQSGFDTSTGLFVEQENLFRTRYLQGGALVAYPFSRSTRVEFSGGLRRIGFDRELHNYYFDPLTGVFLGEERIDLDAPESLTLADVGAAIVRDTSAFGATSPVMGQRLRLDVSPTFGDLNMTGVTVDLRQYVMPIRPVTFAGRVLHVGRYGSSGEDPRLTPLFLGYSTLVRGYHVESFEPGECSPTADGSCPEFDRLIGSRILVVNAEVRAPAVGLFTGRLDYGPVPVELLAFFDAGMAWTSELRPSFANGPREWVTSVGGGARVNVFGFAIAEFNLARPLQRPNRGWLFVFNLRPGF
jgi:hypothetical protein